MRTSLLLVIFALTPLLAQTPKHQGELIFPLESWHNHGSSIVECPDGSLLVCWFHGSGERKADDVKILGARKRVGEQKWSKPFLMADTPGFPDCNPVLFIDSKNKLWLFWITIVDNRWQSSLLKYRTSSDYQKNGAPKWQWQNNIHVKPNKDFFKDLTKDWAKYLKEFPNMVPDLNKKSLKELSADEEIYYYIEKKGRDRLQQRTGWMTRIHPLELPSGKLILPLYSDAYSVCLMAITSDGGKTWTTSRPLSGYGNIQASLVRKKNGTIVAFMRENGPRYKIRLCTSKDEGYTWSSVTNSVLDNPGASVECIALKNGHWLLVYNDTINGRHRLKVSISDDEGASWKWHRYLEKTEYRKGSFSYPSAIQDRKGNIHVTYSYRSYGKKRRKSIKHVKFNESWVTQK